MCVLLHIMMQSILLCEYALLMIPVFVINRDTSAYCDVCT